MAVVSSGVQQWELDEMCFAVGSSDEAAPPSPTDTMLKDVKKKRRRITFTALGSEISALSAEKPADAVANDGTGLAQATLDELAVAESTLFERDDSPIGSALRRKKRSRFSAGGAGTMEMVARAAEIASDIGEMVAEPRKRAGCAKVQKHSDENAENDWNVSNSPSRRSLKLIDAADWSKPSPLSPDAPLLSPEQRRTSCAYRSPLR